MTCHLALPLALMGMLLLVALSTGGALFYMLFCFLALLFLFSLAAVCWASWTLSVSAQLSEETVYRGDDAELLLSVRHGGWLPIAPLFLELSAASGTAREIRLRDMPGRRQTLRMPIHAAHVGLFPSGVRACTVEDLLGIFSRRVELSDAAFDLLVLPRTFTVEPLRLAPGDPGSEIMARATEDLSAPSDIRDYQPGDAIKKIHWKLSLRKGEPLVRTFDEPILQDVLILMDCSSPPTWGHPQAREDVRDTLLETAASVLTDLMKTDHDFRLPLLGEHPVDIIRGMGTAIALRTLAQADFSETDRFERVLLMESRRLRKVGCLVILSARLTSAMVDIMVRMRRMGPNIRFYLITFTPEDGNLRPLLSRLENAGVEISCQTPNLS